MTVVPRELMLELREKRREFREYENEYNKRMSEVEFEQSKGKYDYVQQYLDKLNYILQIAFFTPISPLSSLVALISGVLDTLSARQRSVCFLHPVSCCVGTGELVSGSPCGDCATASAQIDTEFGAIKLKVGFILIFDDIIGLKMQQSIYLRSEGLTYQMESEKELPIRISLFCSPSHQTSFMSTTNLSFHLSLSKHIHTSLLTTYLNRVYVLEIFSEAYHSNQVTARPHGIYS
ncbi:hypothetical protein BLNAU_24909 [Blattamonas nauphoetae]|uniref:Uncharacterized protein n=1 Tax=Blattamonas nauphoetae TaxID=2049346 RepID=A0ABQ9WQ88_9EUKA|nr:hypothetical protein BLNAU_24909 [Blattamonas nauphoetae]